METGVFRPGRALSQALERPVRPVGDEPGGPSTVLVQAGGVDHVLELVWAGRGWPREVVEALAEIPTPWPRRVVLVAPRFSSGSLELLRERNANWVDEAGRARIEGPDGLLVIRDVKPEAAEPPTPAFRWAPSSVDIAELLLADPVDSFSALDVASQSGWSYPQTTKVLRQFAHRGWAAKVGPARGRGSGWRLADAAALLDHWAAHVASAGRERLLTHRALRDPMAFLREELAPALNRSTPWAVSGWAGLEAAAPFVTAVPVLHVYVSAEAMAAGRVREVMRATGLREVEEGARVEFWVASELALELARETASLPVASAPRLYADLRALGGRGDEAADHVREELLGF
jgi:hypothetical protein